MKTWLRQHLAAFFLAWRRLLVTPLNTVLSLLAIGITLTLPAAGWLLIDNLQQVLQRSSGVQQITLFLTLDADREAVVQIEKRLKAIDAGSWQYVAREDALKRLQRDSGMQEIVNSLPRNPLPDAFILDPKYTTPVDQEALVAQIKRWPKIAHVQLDSAWVKRIDSLLRMGQLLLLMLGTVLAAALVAVMFNTIRLQTLARAAEIELALLIGATRAWVRRPFYYFGLVQGALGGVVAVLLLLLGTHILQAPVQELAALYDMALRIRPLSLPQVGILLLLPSLLGWLGVWLSVRLNIQ